MRSLIFASGFAILATAASAQTPPQIIAYPPQNDTVSISLAMEDWVQTQTARVELAVDAAMPGADAGKARGDVLNAVKNLAKDTDWRFTNFDRSTDSSGLERWHAVLEARLPEAQLGGLGDRAKQASKPGMQITVQNVDFTPTLAETEAAKSKLRTDFYKRVNDELGKLNQAEPDRKFRLMRVDFGGVGPQPIEFQRTGKMMAMAAPVPAAAPEAPVELSQKVELRATVTFAALAPKE